LVDGQIKTPKEGLYSTDLMWKLKGWAGHVANE